LTEKRAGQAGNFQVLELGTDGRFLDPYRGGQPVSWQNLRFFLDQAIVIPKGVTDIFVWVHGWRSARIEQATMLPGQVVSQMEALYQAQPDRYPSLASFTGAYIVVNWPSASLPTYRGYARIRERAHQMTEHGHASRILAFLLGYLDQRRGDPHGRGTLRMPTGQYLHCVGHSFGGRFMAEAVIDAANPVTATLPLLPPNPYHQFTVDSLLIFQMAAPPDIFKGRLAPLLAGSPLQGPVCLTFSKHDHATCLFHRLAEGCRGIGCVGAREPAEAIGTIGMRAAGEAYDPDELRKPVVNVDAGRVFRRRRPPSGAHSDIDHPESAHLLLTLVNYSR
jgi:hypothetical protein